MTYYRNTDGEKVFLKDLVKDSQFCSYNKGWGTGYNYYKVTYTKDFTDENYFNNYVNKVKKDRAILFGQIDENTFRVAFVYCQTIR